MYTGGRVGSGRHLGLWMAGASRTACGRRARYVRYVDVGGWACRVLRARIVGRVPLPPLQPCVPLTALVAIEFLQHVPQVAHSRGELMVAARVPAQSDTTRAMMHSAQGGEETARGSAVRRPETVPRGIRVAGMRTWCACVDR